MRDTSKDFRVWYEHYARRLIETVGCTPEHAEIFIYTIISLVVDYAIWDDGDKTQMLLESLYERVMRHLV